ncbi:hypothetical protein TNCV_3329441 [Trichonephila clavipes]|nr:hypothetical protein TNCV_3329441 [Trichonephila clavipes]
MRHFDLDCSNVKYSEDHLFQKCWVILVSNRQRSQWRRSSGTVGCGIAVNAFRIRKCPGVRTVVSYQELMNDIFLHQLAELLSEISASFIDIGSLIAEDL